MHQETRDKKLLKLKHQLKGRLTECAKETGFSTASVSRVLNGVRENDDLLLKIIAYRDKVVGNKAEIYSQI